MIYLECLLIDKFQLFSKVLDNDKYFMHFLFISEIIPKNMAPKRLLDEVTSEPENKKAKLLSQKAEFPETATLHEASRIGYLETLKILNILNILKAWTSWTPCIIC